MSHIHIHNRKCGLSYVTDNIGGVSTSLKINLSGSFLDMPGNTLELRSRRLGPIGNHISSVHKPGGTKLNNVQNNRIFVTRYEKTDHSRQIIDLQDGRLKLVQRFF